MIASTLSIGLIMAWAGCGADPAFALRTTGGQTLSGALVALSAERVEIETPEGRQAIVIDQLAGLKPTSKPQPPERQATAWIELIDGSTLPLQSYAVAKGVAAIKTLTGQEVSLPTDAIASVRFNEQSPAMAEQWAEIAAADRTGDSIVIRKKESLDYQSGVAGEIGEDKVQFTIEGETLSVKRSRVEGMFYFHAAGRNLSDGFCRLSDAAGARLEVAAAVLSEGSLKVATPAGLELRVDLANIASLDGKIQYLSDLTPETSSWTAYFGESSQPGSVQQFYRPRFNESVNGAALLLGGVEYGKGIALYSGAQVVYRLPKGKYSKFKAVAGIDDRARPDGNARLLVYGDDKLLFEGTVTGRDQPTPLEVDVQDVNRLKVLVDYGGEQEVLDHVDICDARILK